MNVRSMKSGFHWVKGVDMKYNERPCNANDCDRWIDEPKICKKCLDTKFSIELNIDIEEDEYDWDDIYPNADKEY